MYRIALFALLLTPLSAAASTVQCGATPCSPEAPTFESFAVSATVSARAKPVDLSSHARAKHFRSVLRAGAAEGPNFAGHYTLVSWGCGTACQELAIVDAETGKVFFPANLRFFSYPTVNEEPMPEPLQFSLNSSLLVIVGSPDQSAKTGIFFYHWNGTELRPVHEELRKW